MRKYIRVEGAISVANGAEDALGDAGLSFGRSFRVGWSPGGALVRPSSSGTIVLERRIPISSSNTLSSKLLQHPLTHSSILPDDRGVPFAISSFASLFPATDASSDASLFRLVSALFDPLSLHLSPRAASPDIRNRVALLTRKAALFTWLQSAVAPAVQEHIQTHPAASAPAAAFAHLTGNQLECACDAAMDGGYPTLATLIAQAGGDSRYRADLREQLVIWIDQKLTHLLIATCAKFMLAC
ncbi:hypothetical protein BT96DRAFT_219351 [Gymnopus androsaceus JB14]|uniref:Nuclear pore complex protein NUP96 C-terminal domain-containing protein n=1 Tax=Gymnopus androsaceus JB14 TaxID=1447944 RepID=A0A6A4H5H6_9AGAR|nr:hypothetical protein BT96DRAFT_219351 [Gymnopus androsaceus JB14]